MKEKLLAFLHSLTPFDFLYFGAVFLLFILLIILTLVLRKRLLLALFTLLIAILEIVFAPTIGFDYFHSWMFKNTITVTKTKKLHFVEAVVVEGKLKNESRFDFQSCSIKATIYKDTHNRFKNLIFKLKPLKSATLTIKDIPKGADGNFKFLIEPFRYKKDFSVSVEGICK